MSNIFVTINISSNVFPTWSLLITSLQCLMPVTNYRTKQRKQQSTTAAEAPIDVWNLNTNPAHTCKSGDVHVAPAVF